MQCGKGLNKKKNLYDHKKSHSPAKESEHQCMVCEINFQSMQSLIEHNNTQHPVQEQPKVIGDKCSNELELVDICEAHNKSTHTETQQHNCMECDHQASSQPLLMMHMVNLRLDAVIRLTTHEEMVRMMVKNVCMITLNMSVMI